MAPEYRSEQQVRHTLAELIEREGETRAGISRLLGRGRSYVHDFLTRGTPRQLAPTDRGMLARYFGVPEHELGEIEW